MLPAYMLHNDYSKMVEKKKKIPLCGAPDQFLGRIGSGAEDAPVPATFSGVCQRANDGGWLEIERAEVPLKRPAVMQNRSPFEAGKSSASAHVGDLPWPIAMIDNLFARQCGKYGLDLESLGGENGHLISSTMHGVLRRVMDTCARELVSGLVSLDGTLSRPEVVKRWAKSKLDHTPSMTKPIPVMRDVGLNTDGGVESIVHYHINRSDVAVNTDCRPSQSSVHSVCGQPGHGGGTHRGTALGLPANPGVLGSGSRGTSGKGGTGAVTANLTGAQSSDDDEGAWSTYQRKKKKVQRAQRANQKPVGSVRDQPRSHGEAHHHTHGSHSTTHHAGSGSERRPSGYWSEPHCGPCFYCRKSGHWKRECPERVSKKGTKVEGLDDVGLLVQRLLEVLDQKGIKLDGVPVRHGRQPRSSWTLPRRNHSGLGPAG
eukprot:TRINITY_DN2805_c0_g1::TRINITY_DN2805_c0_g1_i3::g.5967::m.5967 TRINITY_DN2805_c0_g1::TRINITY_DN2805_c0_g1_i3::g.5967  ORF type:complete len:429 (-),score=10.59,zf-CCHC/PF00098.18/3.5e+03,zf-CCHC/PF00098.18/3.5e+03,zf-CCHC/PF00098.18/5.9e+03,zf-CCHC/PF00098.18/23,zf-CCHC/PF00098.18/3.1e-05 TRINITY_DN2805_c0_g1_i3:551-1837(-)